GARLHAALRQSAPGERATKAGLSGEEGKPTKAKPAAGGPKGSRRRESGAGAAPHERSCEDRALATAGCGPRTRVWGIRTSSGSQCGRAGGGGRLLAALPGRHRRAIVGGAGEKYP